MQLPKSLGCCPSTLLYLGSYELYIENRGLVGSFQLLEVLFPSLLIMSSRSSPQVTSCLRSKNRSLLGLCNVFCLAGPISSLCLLGKFNQVREIIKSPKGSDSLSSDLQDERSLLTQVRCRVRVICVYMKYPRKERQVTSSTLYRLTKTTNHIR